MDNKDVVFPDGLMVKAPRDGAPDFVKGSISIKRLDLMKWLESQDGDWVNLDIKVSKGGKWYSQVNTWKAENKPAFTGERETPKFASDFTNDPNMPPEDDLPF